MKYFFSFVGFLWFGGGGRNQKTDFSLEKFDVFSFQCNSNSSTIGNRLVDLFVLNVELLPKILFAVRSDVENPVSDAAGDESSSLSEPDAMT